MYNSNTYRYKKARRSKRNRPIIYKATLKKLGEMILKNQINENKNVNLYLKTKDKIYCRLIIINIAPISIFDIKKIGKKYSWKKVIKKTILVEQHIVHFHQILLNGIIFLILRDKNNII